MGIVLIIFSSLSAIMQLISLPMFFSASNRLQQIYSETNAVMPFWTKNGWILIVIFLLIDIFAIFYGRSIMKNPGINKKYFWLTVLLLIIILFGIPLGVRYLFLPILMNIYSTFQVY